MPSTFMPEAMPGELPDSELPALEIDPVSLENAMLTSGLIVRSEVVNLDDLTAGEAELVPDSGEGTESCRVGCPTRPIHICK